MLNKIIKITDKKFQGNHIEFTVNEPIWYRDGIDNKISVVNNWPFHDYQIGDFLGIDTNKLHNSNSPKFQSWKDTQAISKVIYKPTDWYNKEVVNDSNFQHGWVREWND